MNMAGLRGLTAGRRPERLAEALRVEYPELFAELAALNGVRAGIAATSTSTLPEGSRLLLAQIGVIRRPPAGGVVWPLTRLGARTVAACAKLAKRG